MRIGPLDITLHRTVRVAEGRAPANLPPSLGRMKLYEVTKYRERCPEIWEDGGVFVGLHDNEALWVQFHTLAPVALLIGAGSINALTGKKLGTKLEADNYLVTPPNPWIDGWKSDDGTVFQFVATSYQKGKGNTVAEQLIGEESKTGGIGIALFEPKEPIKNPVGGIKTLSGDSPYGQPVGGVSAMSVGGGTFSSAPDWCSSMYGGDDMPVGSAGITETSCFASTDVPMASSGESVKMSAKPKSVTGQSVNKGILRSAQRAKNFSEMGLGKGGKIIQKLYPDPYGIEVWKELPTQTRAIYIVHAELLAEITGEPIMKPVVQEQYKGAWFGQDDAKQGDVAGTQAFTGLKSVFADTTVETTFHAPPVEEPVK